MGPLGYKFYTHLSKINKKPSSYVNYTPVRFKLLSSLEEGSYDDFNNDKLEKCCGNGDEQEVPHYTLPGEYCFKIINF